MGILATMCDPTQGMRDKAANYDSNLWAADYKGKTAHKIRIITAGEWLPPNEVQWPGKIVRPRSQSSPPPPEARKGETLRLPGIDGVPRKKDRLTKAKKQEQPMQPLAKPKTVPPGKI